MTLRFYWLVAVATILALESAAQNNCPRTKAKHIPEQVSFQGSQDCGSIKLRIGDTEISSPGQGCPLIASHTFAHEIEVSSTSETMTQVHSQVPSYVYHFRCKQDWWLIIPWGTSCEIARTITGAPQLRMTTIPCPPVTH